jgi:N-methylhydantoinase B
MAKSKPSKKPRGPDRILVSVIGNRFDAISKEIGQTMLRTSRSPIFSEARDFVTAIFDAKMRLVAQTAYIPVLMGALPNVMARIQEVFADDIEDGDVFICNDPYRAGNNHPPDINIIRPLLHRGKVAFWAVSKGHHADVGGGGVAGYNPSAKYIWEEGVRIPPAKLYMAGKPNKALWDMILLNVHLPFLVEGDLKCQVGAVAIGARGLEALLKKYGLATLDAAIDERYRTASIEPRARWTTMASTRPIRSPSSSRSTSRMVA